MDSSVANEACAAALSFITAAGIKAAFESCPEVDFTEGPVIESYRYCGKGQYLN